MDLLYLIRAGLGIPDYWHPRLEIQPDFLSGQIGRYPVSMEVKADYPGQLDDEGVPIVFWGEKGRVSPSPVNIVLYGLGSHAAFVANQNRGYKRQLMHVLQWLDNHQVPLGEGIAWPNHVDMPVYGLRAPWFSAITQGLALSLFVRAHQLKSMFSGLRSIPSSTLAYRTWLAFHVLVTEGGFSREVDGGVIYEEYPGPELDCVFNGMCYALIGLWEGWRSGLISEAEADFHRGVSALRRYLRQFDHDGWSLYSLNRCLGKPFLASPYYLRANGLLAQIIGLMANEPEFCEYGVRWLKTSKSIKRRLEISLRIGRDRFLNAPSLLHFDKAKLRQAHDRPIMTRDTSPESQR